MMFEAALFLAGAVLFFLAVLFLVFLWQDRVLLSERRSEIEALRQNIKEKNVELDVWERELEVWSRSLETEQLALAEAKEELRMLTASASSPASSATPAGTTGRASAGRGGGRAGSAAKNEKLDWDDVKLRS